MTTERQVENQAHEVLRDAIRDAALAKWDRQMATADDTELLAETRPEIAAGVLVDYVVVAVFDSGHQDHDVSVVLRTDGHCSQYRTVGLLDQGVHDVKRGG